MYPILFYIHNTGIRTYDIFVIIGSLCGLLLFFYYTKNFSVKEKQKTIFIAIFLFTVMIIGARIGYLFECFLFHRIGCYKFLFKPVSLWWGLSSSIILAYFTCRIIKINPWKTADIFSIPMATGAIFIRLGCFFNGCCFGVPCSPTMPFATYYPEQTFANKIFQGAPIHPAPLYLMLGWMIILFILIIIKNHKLFNGQMILTIGILYPILRFFVDFIRYYNTHNSLIFSRTASVTAFIISFILFIIKYISYKKTNI